LGCLETPQQDLCGFVFPRLRAHCDLEKRSFLLVRDMEQIVETSGLKANRDPHWRTPCTPAV
jgi:hypothetical protein